MAEKNHQQSPTQTSSADREIVAVRIFNAPRELVFQLWTDPVHLGKWYGPNGFTITMQVMDVRPGGEWQFIMHGPDGTDYPNKNIYREVVRPERIVYSHVSPPHFQTTVTFEPHGPDGQETKLTMRMVFESAEELDRTIKTYNAVEGLEQTLGRLGEQVASIAGSDPLDRDFVVTRTFDAPRQSVFKAWTDPRQMAEWWGPNGFTNPICELDARPGGAWRIVMRGPDGSQHPAKGVYVEVVEPERLVMTINHSELSDEWHDMVNPSRPKGQGNPGLEGLATVTFAEAAGKTTLTVRIRFESAAVRDALLKIGMNIGWSQSLDRLAAVLIG
ncbi:MAG TPA: SRPBCC domain-containing protein [Pirellulales bacterium]|nr:SRPBCC domain-containing protein [Pirellulales bacterium]